MASEKTILDPATLRVLKRVLEMLPKHHEDMKGGDFGSAVRLGGGRSTPHSCRGLFCQLVIILRDCAERAPGCQIAHLVRLSACFLGTIAPIARA
jgi:hypothetical protein